MPLDVGLSVSGESRPQRKYGKLAIEEGADGRSLTVVGPEISPRSGDAMYLIDNEGLDEAQGV